MSLLEKIRQALEENAAEQLYQRVLPYIEEGHRVVVTEPGAFDPEDIPHRNKMNGSLMITDRYLYVFSSVDSDGYFWMEGVQVKDEGSLKGCHRNFVEVLREPDLPSATQKALELFLGNRNLSQVDTWVDEQLRADQPADWLLLKRTQTRQQRELEEMNTGERIKKALEENAAEQLYRIVNPFVQQGCRVFVTDAGDFNPKDDPELEDADGLLVAPGDITLLITGLPDVALWLDSKPHEEEFVGDPEYRLVTQEPDFPSAVRKALELILEGRSSDKMDAWADAKEGWLLLKRTQTRQQRELEESQYRYALPKENPQQLIFDFYTIELLDSLLEADSDLRKTGRYPVSTDLRDALQDAKRQILSHLKGELQLQLVSALGRTAGKEFTSPEEAAEYYVQVYSTGRWGDITKALDRLNQAETESELFTAIDRVIDLEHYSGSIFMYSRDPKWEALSDKIRGVLDFKSRASSLLEIANEGSPSLFKLALAVNKRLGGESWEQYRGKERPRPPTYRDVLPAEDHAEMEELFPGLLDSPTTKDVPLGLGNIKQKK